MALVCNKITKLKKLFANNLILNLNKVKLESIFSTIEKDIHSPHNIRLNHYLSFYNNVKNSNIQTVTSEASSIKPKLVDLENILEDRIINSLNVHENFAHDSLVNTLQSNK